MSDKEHTLEYLQKFYEEHRDWQADVMTMTLSLHDLIVMVRNVALLNKQPTSNPHVID